MEPTVIDTLPTSGTSRKESDSDPSPARGAGGGAPAGAQSRANLVDFYADAEVYDILHGPGTARDIAGLLRIERRFLGPMPARKKDARVWLEPACGSGRYLIAAARRGRRCYGFDIEPAMVEYAKERAAKLPRSAHPPVLSVARMEDFDSEPWWAGAPQVHLAFNLINTIRHLRDDAAMRLHLGAMARVLEPGGIYVVGLHLTSYGREPITEDIWRGTRGTREVTQAVQYIPPSGPRGESARAERVISHLTLTRTRRDGTIEEGHRDSVYTLRAYSLDQWRKIVEGSGLREIASIDEDGEDSPPREGGYAMFVLSR